MTEVPQLTHPCRLHCLLWGTVFCTVCFDLEEDEVFLTDLSRFLSEDLSLGTDEDGFRFCSVFEADNKGESYDLHVYYFEPDGL